MRLTLQERDGIIHCDEERYVVLDVAVWLAGCELHNTPTHCTAARSTALLHCTKLHCTGNTSLHCVSSQRRIIYRITHYHSMFIDMCTYNVITNGFGVNIYELFVNFQA